MVNYIFIFMFIIGLLYAIGTKRVDVVLDALLNTPKESLIVFFTIASMLIFWSGILEICVRSGILSKMTKYVKKIIHPIFRELDMNSKALEYIACNFIANIIGVGSAATPFGLKAMKELDYLNENKEVASKSMITLIVVNTSGLCFIPTSIIALRSSFGSANSSSIIIYLLIVTTITTMFSIILNEVFKRVF
ncbi:MAG: spore maturation protein [Anaeroplasmataceae bacterium]